MHECVCVLCECAFVHLVMMISFLSSAGVSRLMDLLADSREVIRNDVGNTLSFGLRLQLYVLHFIYIVKSK